MNSPNIGGWLVANLQRFDKVRLFYRALINTAVVLHFLVGPAHISGHERSNNFMMDLQFLTRVNESSLKEHDYHVIKISLENSNTSFMMHLSKPDIFSSVDELLNNEMEELHCVYSGSIFSLDGKPVGAASLSSCNYENAFEGLFSIDNHHFHIAPVQDPESMMDGIDVSENQRMKRATSQRSFKYKAAPVPPTSSTAKVRRDSVKVSQKELTEARMQMVKDQECLEDEVDEDDIDNEDEDSNSTDNGDLQTLMDQSDNNGFSEFDSCNSVENLETEYAVRRQGTPNRKGGVRAKNGARRQVKVIELALFTDRSIFNYWKGKYPAKAEAKIKEYLLQLVNEMNYVYHQPSLQEKISFRLVHMGIQKETPNGLSPSRKDGEYLNSFCKFQGKKDTDGALWDHGMMITAVDLLDDKGSSGTIGMAYTGTMCLRYYSCSVIEFINGFETAFTATHEVGHSLGMDHDGENINAKCDPSKFVMAANAGPGQINWSKCSVANLKNFLKSGDPSPGVSDTTTVPRCLIKRGRKKAVINYRRNGRFPGKKFSAKTQCQTMCSGCTPAISNTSPYNVG